MKVAGCQVVEVMNDPERALAVVQARALEAQDFGARLVTFPECFLQGYDVSPSHVEGAAIDLSGSAFAEVARALRELEPLIVLGLIERDSLGCYNSAVLLKRGKLLSRYRKQNLTDGERAVFRPGFDMSIVDVDGMKVAVNICNDLQFRECALSPRRAGARVLACPCNNMLRPEGARQWLGRHNEIRCVRAREADVWLVSSDVTGERGERISLGPTAVIGPDGVVRAQVPTLTEGIAFYEVD